MVVRCTSVLLLGSCLLFYSCSTSFPRNTPGTAYGQIVVGSPRVETRDRLINERIMREVWLNEQLKSISTATFGISGATYLTSLAFLNAQANLAFDPNRRLNAIELDRKKQAAEAALRDEGDMLAMRSSAIQDVIQKYKNKEITYAEACEELEKMDSNCPTNGQSGSGSADAGSGNNSMTASDGSAGPGSGTQSSPASTLLNNEKANVLQPPAYTELKTYGSLSPLEQFQERYYAYDAVQNELSSVLGDDAHDLLGNTLYRLTFDTTVMPYDDASAWAIVQVRVKPDLDLNPSSLLRNASQQYVRLLVEDAESEYRRMLNNSTCWYDAFATLEKMRSPSTTLANLDEIMFRRAFVCASARLGSKSRRTMERYLSSWRPDMGAKSPELAQRRSRVIDLLARPSPGESPEKLRSRLTVWRTWAVWLADVFDIQARDEFERTPISCYKTFRISDKEVLGHFPYTTEDRREQSPNSHCDGLGYSAEAFRDAVVKYVRSSVYQVSPRESFQHLSEVSSNRNASELLFGLSAIAGTAGVEAAIQSIKSNTAQYQAIRRQPIVVGFTEQGNTCSSGSGGCTGELLFGWMFGPSFALSIDGKSTQFRHTWTQKTVAAQISVPAWLSTLGVVVETFWLRENGERIRKDDDGRSVARRTTYNVRLPASTSTVFRTLAPTGDREPVVDDYQYIDVQEGQPATVLIEGRDLFRSAAVYIGSQRADLTTILPSNRGVVGYFKRVNSIAGMSKGRKGTVHLTVHTAEGMALAGQVSIVLRSSKPIEPLDKPAEYFIPDTRNPEPAHEQAGAK